MSEANLIKVATPARRERARRWTRVPFLLYGALLFLTGLSFYLAGAFWCLVLEILQPGAAPPSWIRFILYLTGGTMWLGIGLAGLDLFILLPYKTRRRCVVVNPPALRDLTVVLTAYNDELSIGQAVAEFRSHPLVRRVIVVDNESRDQTAQVATAHGAVVVREQTRGYGHCVYRALREGLTHEDTELTLLCEGDMTFRAYDIDKFMAYISHADIVNGTRIVEQLRSPHTQLTTFMYYGNFFVGKLLEAKHIGQGTFTDVGTTYKLCRNSALRDLMPLLNPSVNLEFNAHFLDTALTHDFHLVECPVTFHNRVGISKGGNKSNLAALKVGIRMIRGIVTSWTRS